MKVKSNGYIILLLLLTACTKELIQTATPKPHPSETSPKIKLSTPADLAIESSSPTSNSANTPESGEYSFNLKEEIVDVYWNEDGTLSLTYKFTFINGNSGAPIDFVDVDIPSQNYELLKIKAQIDGNEIKHIAPSTFMTGAVELGLEEYTISPGETGIVSVMIDQLHNVLFWESVGDEEVQAVFYPTWFDSAFSSGTTDMIVIFHFPFGVDQAELGNPAQPTSWSEEPVFDIDPEGRTTLTWHHSACKGYTQYLFGISFPAIYVPNEEIILPNQIEPRVAQGYNMRAISFMEDAQFNSAIEDLTWSIEIDPSNPYSFLMRGAAYVESDATELARLDLEQALGLGLDPTAAAYAQSLLDGIQP